MEIFVVIPRMTIVILGGMIKPKTPAGPIIAAINEFEYFSSFNLGTKTEPTA